MGRGGIKDWRLESVGCLHSKPSWVFERAKRRNRAGWTGGGGAGCHFPHPSSREPWELSEVGSGTLWTAPSKALAALC